MNEYLNYLINNDQNIKNIDVIFRKIKIKYTNEEMFNFISEYYVVVFGMDLYSSGIMAHGYLKDKGINLPFVV